MKIIIAYLSVVLIWATTPLAIVWSNSSLSFYAASAARMAVALVLCIVVLFVTNKPLVKHKSDWFAFLAAAIGLYPNMLLVYWAAQYISSGVISIMFGLYPFAVGVFSFFLLKQNIFTGARVLALLIALCGLALIKMDFLDEGGHHLVGMFVMLLSVCFFGISSVWLKRVGSGVDPMRLSAGSLVIVVPCFIATWFLLDGHIPKSIDVKSLSSVLYLAVAGSLVGGTLFFYILKVCSVVSVSVITLITPIMALVLGMVLNAETAGVYQYIGCTCILLSLALYQGLITLPNVKIKKHYNLFIARKNKLFGFCN